MWLGSRRGCQIGLEPYLEEGKLFVDAGNKFKVKMAFPMYVVVSGGSDKCHVYQKLIRSYIPFWVR